VALKNGKQLEIAENVASYTAQLGRLIYTTNSETTTTIWVVMATDPNARSVKWGELPSFGLEQVWPTSNGRYIAAVKLDHTFALMEIDLNGEAKEPRIIEMGIKDYLPYGEGLVTLHDTDRMVLRDRASLRPILEANGVTGRSFRFVFSNKALGLAYRSHIDPETNLGRLSLKLLEGGFFEIADDVREFAEVWWPARGLVYAAGGARPGLRVARIEIPCETTSESPWACGF
jgi:hypothetical protein